MPLVAPPRQIVDGGRVAAYGMYAGRIADPNLQEHRPYGALAGLRFKQWHHLAIVHDELAVTLAVVDVGYLKLGWVQAIDRRSGAVLQLERSAPWLDLQVARRLGDDRSWLRSAGLRIELASRMDQGWYEVRVDAGELSVDVTCHATVTPLEVVLPLGRDRAMWSHKVPLPTSGRVVWGDRTVELLPERTTTLFDVHKAHYPRHTWWHWGTFAARDQQDRSVAVNLTRNVVVDPALHENAVWLDGQLSLLDPPTFSFGQEPWRADGREVELSFQGHGERREDRNVGVIVSRFRQRYGLWSGRVADRRVSGFGLVEDHTSVW